MLHSLYTIGYPCFLRIPWSCLHQIYRLSTLPTSSVMIALSRSICVLKHVVPFFGTIEVDGIGNGGNGWGQKKGKKKLRNERYLRSTR